MSCGSSRIKACLCVANFKLLIMFSVVGIQNPQHYKQRRTLTPSKVMIQDSPNSVRPDAEQKQALSYAAIPCYAKCNPTQCFKQEFNPKPRRSKCSSGYLLQGLRPPARALSLQHSLPNACRQWCRQRKLPFYPCVHSVFRVATKSK